ncbi:uncharacterized protein [Ambystoma mexicanum]|uniref:uncharacterized protein isoform X2 n=1 Tax=Ambystoma mexicanum TaxID=8296 RepID=UPI0037E884A1
MASAGRSACSVVEVWGNYDPEATRNLLLFKVMQEEKQTEKCTPIMFYSSWTTKVKETLLENLRKKWSASFVKYFEEKLSKDILTKAGRWFLETVGIYKKTSRVTTNVSESMNAVMKRLTKHKEVYMDEMVLVIYFLQHFI